MQGSPASAAVAAPAVGQNVYAGEYRLRDQIRGAMRGTGLQATGAVRYVGRDAIRPGGYSLAIPISLITRSYLAS